MFDIDIETAVEGIYFKGGPEDNFISGIWIGDKIQENKLFSNCTFNGVKAEFKSCIFIDCINPPIDESCLYIQLPANLRATIQQKTATGWV